MNFLDLARNRYTTKKYNSSKRVSASDVETLKEVMRLCPSSINSQPWRFVFVSDKSLKEKLAEVSRHNIDKIKAASHLVVFLAKDDVKKFEQEIPEYLPAGAINYYNDNVRTKGEEGVRAWMRNQVYLSLGFFLSACAAMKIDSTPMEGIQTEEYDKILCVDGYKTVFAAAIGYRSADDPNRPEVHQKERKSLEAVVEER